MDTLREIYEKHNGRFLNKWDNYIDVYDKFFQGYRNKEITFLEIGIAHGGSLEMWRNYFGDKATLIGVDVNPETKKFEEGNTKVFIGSQEDVQFLNTLKTQIPKVDILLDDGGHTMNQQITTFKAMFEHVKDTGLYVCEDLHTSYWSEYGGGFKKKNTFIEFSKNLIDFLHGWHARESDKPKMDNLFTRSIYGVHYYDSMVVIEKQPVGPPTNTYKGNKQLEKHYQNYGQKEPLLKKLKRKISSKLK
jgi:hypothetical protein